MTTAQRRLGMFVEWIVASSRDAKAPLGKDTIVYGPYAVFVPQELSEPPNPTFAPEHLPLWIPNQQSIPGLPPSTQDPPLSRGSPDSRVRHIVWKWLDGWFQGALIGLPDPTETLRASLDRHLPGLDLVEHAAIFMPLWPLAPEVRGWVERQLPILTK